MDVDLEMRVASDEKTQDGFHHVDAQFKTVEAGDEVGVSGEGTHLTTPCFGAADDLLQQVQSSQFSADPVGGGLIPTVLGC